MHRVFLVPGFLGFEHFGSYHYFDESVLQILRKALGKAVASVERLSTSKPTGSLAERQRDLLYQLAHETRPDDKIHLVGHSTGGVDAYTLLGKTPLNTPQWDGPDAEVRQRIRSVTAIAAPFWGSFLAEQVAGALPVPPPLPPLDLLAGMGGNLLAGMGLISLTHHDLLTLCLDVLISGEGPTFVLKTLSDLRLLTDLRPAAMSQARLEFQQGLEVPFAYFVTVAPPPTLQMLVTRPVFTTAYVPTAADRNALPSGVDPDPLFVDVDWIGGGRLPIRDFSANDGIVNSLRQVIPGRKPTALVRADHADVIGHFRRAPHDPGLLDSLSGFDQDHLAELWRKVADNIRAGI
jgi:pimeloyl-ACP methyl ester carboxylesterase